MVLIKSKVRMVVQVVWNEGKGRHGVATRDVVPGEVGVDNNMAVISTLVSLCLDFYWHG